MWFLAVMFSPLFSVVLAVTIEQFQNETCIWEVKRLTMKTYCWLYTTKTGSVNVALNAEDPYSPKSKGSADIISWHETPHGHLARANPG